MKKDSYGMLAEFSTADALLHAARRARRAGYRRIEAYAPFPIGGLDEAVGDRHRHVPLIAVAGGLLGGVGSWFLQWYSAVVDYPFQTGARPHGWPAFVPAAFGLALLGAALAAALGMLLASALPKLYYPQFDISDVDLATRSRFFLCLPAHDPAFDSRRSKAFLDQLEPLQVREVAA